MAGERNVRPKPTFRQYSLDHPMEKRSLFRAVFNHRKRLNQERLGFSNSENYGGKIDATRGSRVISPQLNF